MPLADVSMLQQEILKVMTDTVETEEEAIAAWGDAIAKYYGTAIIPPGGSAVTALIEESVKSALQGMSAEGVGIMAIPNAFLAGATALSGSPANAPGVTAPPPVPPPISLGAPMPAEEVAVLIATTVATWVITGTYTVAPASPVPWS
jgi:hypothetical protein